ncbi:MAG: hypothetical protein UY70_C0019G0008 [Candidatus Kaiserbacteria bacterium GW2011_GWB1_52_6]|uniref:Uncharacterized protein n=2 Tax=Candidatus Kaiseribacteriota TaxID=1752734 RepID=A0A0G1X768_9BACT|nr:MAG: hypothetical protein UY67_C0027G0008 [Candidatus Kaiserbacteria bacterium GW2011_GWA2_52_12]KKW27013.1 MAG: hypothetical protein UY70_C0019G0008 [Candidatus Kaiserbacteria bacterium GW2011_GWB1_52_6]
MKRFVAATLLSLTVLASFPAIGYVDERDEQPTTPITECVLKSEATTYAKAYVAEMIGIAKRNGLTPREGAEERLLQVFLEAIGKGHLIVDRAEDCPQDKKMYYLDDKN